MRERLDKMMQSFNADDYTVKMVKGIFSVVPLAPKFDFYHSLDDAIRTVAPNATPQQIDRARVLSQTEEVENALWILDALDTGDSGIAMYTGLKSAFNLFFSSKSSSFESDPQQTTDAALKALGLAYAIHKLFPGSAVDKVKSFKSIKAGEAIAIYYGAVEVAVPFADNVVSSGGTMMDKLMGHGGNDHIAKFAAVAGQGAVGQATAVLTQMTSTLEGVIGAVHKYVDPIANSAKSYLPSIGTMDKVTGALATGADMMPVWRLLGSRLAAEAVVYRAVHGQ